MKTLDHYFQLFTSGVNNLGVWGTYSYDFVLTFAEFCLQQDREAPNLLEDFSKAIGVSVELLKSKESYQEVAEARGLYWKLRYEKYGWTYRRMAQELGKTISNPQYGINKINSLLEIKDRSTIKKWNRVKHL